MIRGLAQCPYCQQCELALDDHPQLVFNPGGGGAPRPCQHLAWVDGRYSQWERTPHGTDRVIGSTEFRYVPDWADDSERLAELSAYLNELLQQGPAWAFAPPVPIAIVALNAEEKTTDARGHGHPVWDVDGFALYAADASAFWTALPESRDRHLASMRMGGG